MFLLSLMGTAQRYLRAELDLSILETVSGKEGNVNQDRDHILVEISSTFFHNTDHMLAQIAGELPLLICNCALPLNCSYLLLRQVILLVWKTEYCEVCA